jgi:hypothetical protein
MMGNAEPVTISLTYVGLLARDGALALMLRVTTIGLLLLVPVTLAIASGSRRLELIVALGVGLAMIGIASFGVRARLRLISALWRSGVLVRVALERVSEEEDDDGTIFFRARYPFRVGERAAAFSLTRSFLVALLRGDFPLQVVLLVDPERPEDRLRVG